MKMHNIYNTYIHTLCNILAILHLHEIASTLKYFSFARINHGKPAVLQPTGQTPRLAMSLQVQTSAVGHVY